jgi:hypothetical protein
MMRSRRSSRHLTRWRRHLQEQLLSGNVIAAVGFVALTAIAVAYLAGLRHVLPNSGTSFTVMTEVAANVRALILFGLLAVPFLTVAIVFMEMGFLFPWRRAAFALAVGIGVGEAIGPFFDLYNWITAALVGSMLGGTIVIGACQSLQRREGALKEWFAGRYRLFEQKMEAARAERLLGLPPVAGLATDALLVVFCLSTLAYWAGEAHAMKSLHLWG